MSINIKKQLQNMDRSQLRNILEKLEIEYSGKETSEMVRLILLPLQSHKMEVKDNQKNLSRYRFKYHRQNPKKKFTFVSWDFVIQ